jgi:hypothetical protein
MGAIVNPARMVAKQLADGTVTGDNSESLPTFWSLRDAAPSDS